MKKYLVAISLWLFLLISLISCKKESAPAKTYDTGAYPGKAKLVRFTGTYGTGLYQNPNSTAIYYNVDGSVNRYEFLDKNLSITSTKYFHYTPGIVTGIEISTSGDTAGYEKRFIDRNGVIDSIMYGNSEPHLQSAIKPHYDGQGHVGEVKMYLFPAGNSSIIEYASSAFYTYDGGNIQKFRNYATNEIQIFEYTDFDNTIADYPFFDIFFKTEKLIKRVFLQRNPGEVPVLFSKNEYTFNSSNQVVTDTNYSYYSDGTPSGSSITRTIEYYQ